MFRKNIQDFETVRLMVRIFLSAVQAISIWCVSFFYCYYFAERFSFVGSFEIGSSNIWNDVIRIKFWMKQGVNQSNMKTVLDEPENVGRKFCSRSNFHPTQYIFMEHDFFFYFLLFLRSVRPIRYFIQHGILLCWMKYCIGLTRSLFC